MVKCRYAKDGRSHFLQNLKYGVNKGSNGRSAGKDDQDPEQEQGDDNRQEPEFFPHLQKAPEVFYEIHCIRPS